ncbi:MAG: hypothetical protein AAFY41_12690, partial [Bacteroidota bacterium]
PNPNSASLIAEIDSEGMGISFYLENSEGLSVSDIKMCNARRETCFDVVETFGVTELVSGDCISYSIANSNYVVPTRCNSTPSPVTISDAHWNNSSFFYLTVLEREIRCPNRDEPLCVIEIIQDNNQ